MKKILSVIVFALVAVCVIAPKFIAPKFQEQVAAFIDKINKTPGYSANIESTESSWFGSQNTLLISLDLSLYDPSLLNEKIEVTFLLDTQFGPLLFADQGIVGLFKTDLKIAADEQRDLLIWDDASPLYQLSALGEFDGEIQFKDKVPAFTDIEKAFTFSGYNGEGKINNDAVSYDGLLELVNLDHYYLPTKAENITLSMDWNAGLETMMKGGFYDASTNLSVESFTMSEDLSVSNASLLMNLILDEETQLGTIEMGFLAKKIIAESDQVNDLTFKTELTKLSNQFFLDFTRFNNELLEQDLDAEELVAEQLSFLGDNIEALLAPQPEFNITDLSGSYPEGKLNANLTSKLDIDSTNTPTSDELLLPQFWIYNMLADANIEIDDVLLVALGERAIAKQIGLASDAPEVTQQVKFFIDLFEEQGFFAHEDNQYRSKLKLKDGKTYINGKLVPLF